MSMKLIKTIIHKIARYLYFVGHTYYNSTEYYNFINSPKVNSGKGTTFYSTSKVLNQRNDKEYITIGENTHIKGELLTFNKSGKIKIGNNCYIGENTKIWAMESITIGNNVLIAHNVNIIDNNSHSIDPIERRDEFSEYFINSLGKDYNIEKSKIIISDDVWIGLNTVILKGVKIGKGTIIAAGSVLTNDAPENVIMAGNPAKVVKNIPNFYK